MNRPKKGAIRKLLVVGWDGADPDLIDSLCARGRLAHLKSLMERGVWGRLTSTFPPSSLPAWTSALTGVGPGSHGLLNYVRKEAGCYRLRLVDARERAVESLMALAHRAGMKVASLGVPGSYPPDPHAGLCIAGFDSPFALRAGRQAYQPAELYETLRSRGLGWPYGDMDESAVGLRWHYRARKTLFSTMREKLRTAEFILKQQDPFDLFFIVFSETDTAGHHFWAFHDKQSPRHINKLEFSDVLEEVYHELDHCLGVLLGYIDQGATVIVLSDHGFGGASDKVVYVNRWLASRGYLSFDPHGSLMARTGGLLRDVGGRWMPARLKQSVLRGSMSGLMMRTDALSRFGGLDLKNTRAFSDELPQYPGIWINLKGRDAMGIVEPGAEYQELRQELVERLSGACSPDGGQPLVSRVFLREQVVPGHYMGRAPDLLVELGSPDGYSMLSAQSDGKPGLICRKLSASERIGSKGIGISGIHLPEGILVMAGSRSQDAAEMASSRIEDVFHIMASVLGLDVDGLSKNKKIEKCLPELDPNAMAETDCGSDEANIRKRLEDLGYL